MRREVVRNFGKITQIIESNNTDSSEQSSLILSINEDFPKQFPYIEAL